MRPICLVVPALLIASAAAAQDPITLLVASAEQGIALRWSWPEGERPIGFIVERQGQGEAGFTRLTPQPITRMRDRAAARSRLGAEWDRYEGLLFPADPRAERADPDSWRSVLLLAADVEPAVAHLLGLRFDDASAQPGASYQYRLIALTSRGEVVAATSGVVAARGFTAPAGPTSLSAALSTGGVALRWDPAPSFTAYHIYRGASRDGAGARRINGAPVIVLYDGEGARTESAPTFFTDSTAPRNDTAFYWVEGVDAFGRTSQRAGGTPAVLRDVRLPPAPLAVLTSVSGDTVTVTWVPNAGNVVAWQVWRADTVIGPFQRLGSPVPVAITEFKDAGRPSRRVIWYRVTGLSPIGEESPPSPMALAEVADPLPPAIPAGLTGVADTGRIRFEWAAVADRDLLGYRIYRGIDDTEFGLVTRDPSRATSFTDTIPAVADRPFRYRVTAVDSAFNESAPSEVLVLRPPDILAPSAPRIAVVRRGDQSLVVEWLGNPEPDIVAYQLRYRATDGAWLDAADTVAAERRTDTIPALVAGTRYEVSLIAIDDAGNRSLPAPPVAGIPTRLDAAPAPELRRASYERASRAVILEWTSPAEDVVEVLVLRREDDGAFRPVGEATPGETRFADPTARASRRYEYALRARDRAGRTAESRPRRVTTPEPPR